MATEAKILPFGGIGPLQAAPATSSSGDTHIKTQMIILIVCFLSFGAGFALGFYIKRRSNIYKFDEDQHAQKTARLKSNPSILDLM